MLYLRRIVVVTMLLGSLAVKTAQSAEQCVDQAEHYQQQLQVLRSHVSEAVDQMARLQQNLIRAEQRNRSQSDLIEQLESELEAQRPASLIGQRAMREQLFARLRQQLPLSPVYQVAEDHLSIANDLVFVFGTGELGAEGESRLRALAKALVAGLAQLPSDASWRLRVEGHTDKRAIRSNRRFSDNWSLSTARAVAVLRFLNKQGVPSGHIEAAGLAATRLLDLGENKPAHRRNRRIELHLVFDPA